MYGSGKGYLGVIYTELPDGTIKIVDILKGSPAERSGFRYGDRIEKFNGIPLRGNDSLTGTVRSLPPGTRVSVEVTRLNGDREVIEVVIERSPDVRLHPAPGAEMRSGGEREAPPDWQEQWSVDQ